MRNDYKSPSDLAADQRDNERFSDDPAKENRLVVNGEVVKDEYFRETELADFDVHGRVLKELIKTDAISENFRRELNNLYSQLGVKK